MTQSGECRWIRELDGSGGRLLTSVVPFLYWQGPHGRSVMATHYPVMLSKLHKAPLLDYQGHLHDRSLPSTLLVKYMNVGWDVDY